MAESIPSNESVYLRLAGPLQSWATLKETGSFVYSEDFPTLSGIRGLIAGSLGLRRDEIWPSWLLNIEVLVRADMRGSRWLDFQTINPRDEDLEFQQRLFRIVSGEDWSIKHGYFTPDGQNGTAIVRRYYLEDAEFLIEIRANDHSQEVFTALQNPTFINYLGKKQCAPTFPFLLGIGKQGLLDELPTRSRGGSRLVSKWFSTDQQESEVPMSRLEIRQMCSRDSKFSVSSSTVQVKPVDTAQWMAEVARSLIR